MVLLLLGDAPASPKEKRSAVDKRKLKKSESGEKRRLKTRKSSKNKDKEATTASAPVAAQNLMSSVRGEEMDHESLAFDSSDEVMPLMAQDSDDGSLAMSTTNIRTLGRSNYTMSGAAAGSRVSYHSQMSSADGAPLDGQRMLMMEEDEAIEVIRRGGGTEQAMQEGRGRATSAALPVTSKVSSSKHRRGDLQQQPGSDSDDDEDGSVTWSSTAAAVDAQYRKKRASSGLYDGLSSAHSSDSESMKRRSYLKPRPATERRTSPIPNQPANLMSPGGVGNGNIGGNSTQTIGVSSMSMAPTSPGVSPVPGKRGSGTFRAAAYDDDRIKINVGGRIFETYVSTLRKYPHTLLGTMLHPRNAHMLNGKVSPDGKPSPDTELFFDRNPRMFEVILDFYRTSTINRPPDVTWEMLQEELSFFQIDLPEYTNLSKRVSVELRKLEYKDLILPASEYRKMMRVKLLKDHHTSIVRILDFIQRKIQRKADAGHNTSTITFYSPLHYTNSTPREIFKVISTNEVRELLIELLKAKDFAVKETNEYSKTKTTSIIGLHDQIINYNDPQYFSFHIKW